MYTVYWCDEDGEEQSKSFSTVEEAREFADAVDDTGCYATIRTEE